MKLANFKIYQGILCLETDTVQGQKGHGSKWWDWGFELSYTPYRIDKISQIKVGKLSNSPRVVMAVETPDGWVAVNLPRSDIPTMQKFGLWSDVLDAPYEGVAVYEVWPERL